MRDDIMDMDKADMAAELSKLRKEVVILRLTVRSQAIWLEEVCKQFEAKQRALGKLTTEERTAILNAFRQTLEL